MHVDLSLGAANVRIVSYHPFSIESFAPLHYSGWSVPADGADKALENLMLKKLASLFALCLVASTILSASPADDGIIGQADAATSIIVTDGQLAADDLVLADVPISYGEEGFRERILERTGGERDPIGLVLTGGSARAFAHLGVLKYLEEQGIEPDFIISNSMGSIIAMLYAAGLSPDQIISMITSGDLSTFFKLTIPLEGGLLDPSGFKGLVDSIVGSDLQIEDLDIPVMVIAQDLVTKREVRIMEGSFSDVLMASFAIPAYFPPQEYRGHLLIDGGIVNLAPIDVAYDYCDQVIVSTTFYDNDELNLRNILNIINTSFEISKRQNAANQIRTYGDRMIWIRCAVEQFSFMDFAAVEEMAAIGYESAAAEAGSLSTLYKHGLSQSIADKRSLYQVNIEHAIQNQQYFARVEQPTLSNTFTLGIHSFQTNEYPYYLRNTFDIGMEWRLATPHVELSVLGGGAFDATSNMNAEAHPLISVDFTWYPVPPFRLSLYSALTFESRPVWYVPTLYIRQGMDWKIFSNRLFTVEFNQAFEIYQDFYTSYNGVDEDEYMLTAQFKGYVNIVDYARLNLATAYMLHSPDFSHFYQYMQVKADTRLYLIPDSTTFFLELGFFSRFSVDGKGGVPLFISDGFLTNNQEAYSRNRVDDNGGDKEGGQEPYLIILPLSFGYAFTAEPSFGELVMVDYLELSLFCDLMFRDGATPAFTTGVELQGELSLIGLQDLPMTLRVGYDQLSEDIIVSLRFTVTK